MKYSYSPEMPPTIRRILNAVKLSNIRMVSNANTNFVTSPFKTNKFWEIINKWLCKLFLK